MNVDGSGPAEGVPEMDVTQLQQWLDEGRDFQLVDVREPYEWQICNLGPQGARLTPLGVFPTVVGELDPATPLVVYCRSGGAQRSGGGEAAGSGLRRDQPEGRDPGLGRGGRREHADLLSLA